MSARTPTLTTLRRPRWLYCLDAFLFSYFWLPCHVCGRKYSGWEWSRAECPSEYRGGGMGEGCCPACAPEVRSRNAKAFAARPGVDW